MRKRLSYRTIFGTILILAIMVSTYAYVQRKLPETKDATLPCLTMTDAKEKTGCINNALTSEAHLLTGKAVLAKAEQLQKQGQLQDCHETSHAIGKALLKKYNNDVGKAFIECTHNCIDGCFHGVMETKVQSSLNEQGSLEHILLNACTTFTDEVVHRQCVHGIGHGLASHGALKLDAALNVCLSMHIQTDKQACTSGALMEYVSLFLAIPNQSLSEIVPTICKEPTTLDAAGKPGLLEGCISAIGQGLMLFSGYNVQQSLEACKSLPMDQAEVCSWSANQENLDHLNDLKNL